MTTYERTGTPRRSTILPAVTLASANDVLIKEIVALLPTAIRRAVTILIANEEPETQREA